MRLRILMFIALIALSACGGAQNTSVTGTPDSQAVEISPTISDEQLTLTPLVVIDVTMPPVGTMVAPATEDPDAGQIFDAVYLEQTGGLTGIPLTIEVHSDGRVVRDGVTGSVTPEQVTVIDDLIREINFFGIQGVFTTAAANPDAYQYKISVERAGASRTIAAQDGYTPEELLALINAVSVLGAGS